MATPFSTLCRFVIPYRNVSFPQESCSSANGLLFVLSHLQVLAQCLAVDWDLAVSFPEAWSVDGAIYCNLFNLAIQVLVERVDADVAGTLSTSFFPIMSR